VRRREDTAEESVSTKLTGIRKLRLHAGPFDPGSPTLKRPTVNSRKAVPSNVNLGSIFPSERNLRGEVEAFGGKILARLA
jgi:hypothetical protein